MNIKIEVYTTTPHITHFSTSSGNDFTKYAAMNTATTPAIVNEIEAFLLYAFSFTNLNPSATISIAVAAIIIGKAVAGCIPIV